MRHSTQIGRVMRESRRTTPSGAEGDRKYSYQLSVISETPRRMVIADNWRASSPIIIWQSSISTPRRIALTEN
jgi:hypothetical protein